MQVYTFREFLRDTALANSYYVIAIGPKGQRTFTFSGDGFLVIPDGVTLPPTLEPMTAKEWAALKFPIELALTYPGETNERMLNAEERAQDAAWRDRKQFLRDQRMRTVGEVLVRDDFDELVEETTTYTVKRGWSSPAFLSALGAFFSAGTEPPDPIEWRRKQDNESLRDTIMGVLNDALQTITSIMALKRAQTAGAKNASQPPAPKNAQEPPAGTPPAPAPQGVPKPLQPASAAEALEVIWTDICSAIDKQAPSGHVAAAIVSYAVGVLMNRLGGEAHARVVALKTHPLEFLTAMFPKVPQDYLKQLAVMLAVAQPPPSVPAPQPISPEMAEAMGVAMDAAAAKTREAGPQAAPTTAAAEPEAAAQPDMAVVAQAASLWKHVVLVLDGDHSVEQRVAAVLDFIRFAQQHEDALPSSAEHAKRLTDPRDGGASVLLEACTRRDDTIARDIAAVVKEVLARLADEAKEPTP